MVDLHLVRFNICGTVLLDGAVVDQERLVEARVRFQPRAGDELVMGGQRNAKLFSIPLIWLTLKWVMIALDTPSPLNRSNRS